MTAHETAEPDPGRPWETAESRPIGPAERELLDRYEGVLSKMIVDRPMSFGIVTSAPAPAPPITWPTIKETLDRVMAEATYVRDRVVIGRGRWDRILAAASPELRAQLESLAENGTVIVSEFLPDPDTAYRISTRPQDWAPPARAYLWPHLARERRMRS